MNLQFTQEEQKFQKTIRAWMRKNVPEEIGRISALGEMPEKSQQQQWEKRLGEQGWLVIFLILRGPWLGRLR